MSETRKQVNEIIKKFLPPGGLMQMHDEIMENPMCDPSSAKFAMYWAKQNFKENADGTFSINRPRPFKETKMKIKTAEQLAAEIAIHKKTGATAKVKLLEEQLALVLGSTDGKKPSPLQSGSQEDKKTEEKSISEKVTTPQEGGNPLDKIEADHDKEMSDAKDEMAKTLNEMYESGMTWKEVAETTGEKNAYNKVKAWKKRQQQT